MSESPETRRKRLLMRSMRRGIREMDLMLGSYAGRMIPVMTEQELDAYEDLLAESDRDLYQWAMRPAEAPPRLRRLIEEISNTFREHVNCF